MDARPGKSIAVRFQLDKAEKAGVAGIKIADIKVADVKIANIKIQESGIPNSEAICSVPALAIAGLLPRLSPMAVQVSHPPACQHLISCDCPSSAFERTSKDLSKECSCEYRAALSIYLLSTGYLD